MKKWRRRDFLWSEAEIKLILAVLGKKNILKLIDGKKYRRTDIFKVIEKEFKEKRFDKNYTNIDNKWNKINQK